MGFYDFNKYRSPCGNNGSPVTGFYDFNKYRCPCGNNGSPVTGFYDITNIAVHVVTMVFLLRVSMI